MRKHRFQLAAWAAALGLAAATTSVQVLAQDPPPPKRDKPADEPKKGDEKKKEEKRAGPEVGKPAPGFELKDLDGKTVKLADFKGKTVVLEWFNPECPAVVIAHGDGSLKDLAGRWTKDGVVWLAINSGGPGKEGTGVEKNKKGCEKWKMSHPVLLDESGEVGRAYGSKNTPTMYIVDGKGVLAYRGALDNAPYGKLAKDAKLEVYVDNALADLKAGKPVTLKETRPYG